MAKIIVYTPLAPPTTSHVDTNGRQLSHRCEDEAGRQHQQRLPLGSVSGVVYLDALCLYCGKHFVWVDDDAPVSPRVNSNEPPHSTVPSPTREKIASIGK